MKKLYALLLFQIIVEGMYAQSPFWACGRDFLNPYPGLTVGYIYNEYYGKGAPGSTIPNFTDVRYAEDNGEADGVEELRVPCRVHPDPAYDCLANDADANIPQIKYIGSLRYDIYYPIVPNQSVPLTLPAIFVFHPGGFSDCSYKYLPGMRYMCEQFALRGFVVFNVEYRRGIIQDQNPPLTYSTVQQQMAIYRACQDA